MAMLRKPVVQALLALTLSFAVGCAGGGSGVAGRAIDQRVVAKVGDREASARSATANMLYVSSGDEQTANARLVEAAGGGVLLPQSALTPERLLGDVEKLLTDPARLKQMGERARGLAMSDAAERLATVIEEVARAPVRR